jgi:hypothetical protein
MYLSQYGSYKDTSWRTCELEFAGAKILHCAQTGFVIHSDTNPTYAGGEGVYPRG